MSPRKGKWQPRGDGGIRTPLHGRACGFFEIHYVHTLCYEEVRARPSLLVWVCGSWMSVGSSLHARRCATSRSLRKWNLLALHRVTRLCTLAKRRHHLSRKQAARFACFAAWSSERPRERGKGKWTSPSSACVSRGGHWAQPSRGPPP